MNTIKNISTSYKAIITLALAVLMLTVTIFTTYAYTDASIIGDYIILESGSGIPALYEVEVGTTRTVTIANLNQARSGDESLAVIDYDNSGLDNVRITGQKAGVATVAYGTSVGTVIVNNWQVVDSNNISYYVIKDNGEVALKGSGDAKYAPVEIIVGTNNITWRSMNEKVAKVDGAGLITGYESGSSIVIGEFADKWGAAQTIVILVSVGT